MAGHGRRGSRLVEIRKVGDHHYEAIVELDNGRLVRVEARIVGDIVETPFGSYHIPELYTQTLTEGEPTAKRAEESWLVEFDEAKGEVKAKLSVKIVAIEASKGSRVDENTVVMLVETMKMVNEVHAPCPGIVTYVTDKPSVGKGEVLFKIKCEE
jgi:biotin carboxyl carrier protein